MLYPGARYAWKKHETGPPNRDDAERGGNGGKLCFNQEYCRRDSSGFYSSFCLQIEAVFWFKWGIVARSEATLAIIMVDWALNLPARATGRTPFTLYSLMMWAFHEFPPVDPMKLTHNNNGGKFLLAFLNDNMAVSLSTDLRDSISQQPALDSLVTLEYSSSIERNSH